jgi:hypothetical protein
MTLIDVDGDLILSVLRIELIKVGFNGTAKLGLVALANISRFLS